MGNIVGLDLNVDQDYLAKKENAMSHEEIREWLDKLIENKLEAIALRYLMANNQTVTLEDISYLTGISSDNVPRCVNNLKKANLVIVDKIKGNKGLCNTYQLFY